jgi:hypothetical protein
MCGGSYTTTSKKASLKGMDVLSATMLGRWEASISKPIIGRLLLRQNLPPFMVASKILFGLLRG